MFSASMNAAVPRHLDTSPCFRIQLPEPTQGHERYLEPEEAAAVMQQLAQPDRKAAALLLGTGMRFGEMAGLHVQRLDAKRGTAEVVETWSRHSRQITRLPKGARRRTVVVPNWVLTELGELSTATSCGPPHEDFGVECRSGLVVPSPEGVALDSHNMLVRHWKPAMEAVGTPKARQHDLRHSFASLMAQDGASMDLLADLLGHASTRTTKIYRHLNPGYFREARKLAEGIDPNTKRRNRS